MTFCMDFKAIALSLLHSDHLYEKLNFNYLLPREDFFKVNFQSDVHKDSLLSGPGLQ